jgi:energy-coupling factor transport system permease protein
MNDALLGKYYAADSAVHNLDARIKITAMLAMMGAIFACGSYAALGVCALFIAAAFALSHVPAGQALPSIAPLMFIVVITAIINIFFEHDGAVLLQLGPIVINQGGVHLAVFMGIRLTLLLLVASLLTLTTTTIDLTDGMEALLKPFAKIGFPAHEFAMILGIALRFLPQFMTESNVIRAAQASRGAHFSANVFKDGLKGISSLMVPLFTSAFRHAETLSGAMEALCYHGGTGRTKLNPFKLRAADGLAMLLVCVCIACVVALNILL